MTRDVFLNTGEIRITAIYGSPRRKGNTSLLLDRAAQGALEAGAQVDRIVLRDLDISPCMEYYGCKKDGRCIIPDDFEALHDRLLTCDGIMLASPIFFYAVSAHTKIFMDRCQAFWVRKYCIEKAPLQRRNPLRKGLFIAVGAGRGKRLFEGALLSVRYFLDVFDMDLFKALLYSGIEERGDILHHPEHLEEARCAGRDLCRDLKQVRQR